MVNIGNDWDGLLKELFEAESYKSLREFLKTEYRTKRVYPDMYDIFNALKYTPYESVKVVILGQDPYHGAGQAHGLAFSVKPGVPAPPSLINIFKELNVELGVPVPSHGCLEKWAKEGVLLLNTALTVREGVPNSHRGKGWEELTDGIIKKLSERETPMVFMLWGANAKAKAPLIDGRRHLVLKAAHPSPLSETSGFFGCGHFAAANEFLKNNGITPVDWSL
ncbi:MAG: uracil-DNA glycosylase [Clostridia bacterium]|nr:uracil-DNA glycosylase [Clostridia bacterium]